MTSSVNKIFAHGRVSIITSHLTIIGSHNAVRFHSSASGVIVRVSAFWYASLSTFEQLTRLYCNALMLWNTDFRLFILRLPFIPIS